MNIFGTVDQFNAEKTSPSMSPLRTAIRTIDKLNVVLEIAKAMTAEHNIDQLLEIILREAGRVLECDRGSVFIVDREKGELWTRVAQGDIQEIRMPMTEGLAGAVATTGEIINLRDAYDDPRFNREFDVKNGYRTRSVLCVPMRNTRGEITGVLQALNATDGCFDAEDQDLLLALGGQAAAAIDNARLYDQVNKLFEGFVDASVGAIESRDPTTAGHSGRVAALTVGLAQALQLAPSGPYRGKVFTDDQIQEIRYASLLHDFGKIGVREPVLVKANKLYPHELELLQQRFQLARKDRQVMSLQRRFDGVKVRGVEQVNAIEREEQERLAAELAELDRALEFILQCNRPTVLTEGGFEKLSILAQLAFNDAYDSPQMLLTPNEVSVLSIPRGSLSATERAQIEKHVTYTFKFLKQIPWTAALAGVPDIAHAHHEKLDGKGYPRRIGATEIPVQSKMMAISDIYDALTASDRPYKKAVPHELALDILKKESDAGQLDSELFKIFVEGDIARRALKGGS